jgi:hypothetical protein
MLEETSMLNALRRFLAMRFHRHPQAPDPTVIVVVDIPNIWSDVVPAGYRLS